MDYVETLRAQWRGAPIEAQVALSLLVVGLFSAISITYARKSKAMPAYLAYASAFLYIGLPTLLIGAASGTRTGYFCGAVGATAAFTSIVVHHHSLGLLITGAGAGMVLLESMNFDLEAIRAEPSLAVFLLVSFLVCYIASQQGVVLLFGPGTTTLFSLLVSGALWQATEYFLPSRLSVLSTAALALLPVLLMKTGYPDYLTPGPKLTHTVLSLASVAAGAVALLLLQADAAAVAAGAFTPLLLALAVLIAVSYLLRAVEWKPAVLGPFYHFERRATVLTAMAYTLLNLEVATATPGTAGVAAPGLSLLLLHLSLGYALTVALLALQQVLLDPLQLYYSGAYRAASVDYFAVVILLSSTVGILLNFSDKTPIMMAFFGRVWELSGAPAAAPYLQGALPAAAGTWAAAWYYALVSSGLYLLSTLLLTSLSRSSLLLAPYYADAAAKGNPRSPAAALTFNGEPAPATQDALLEVLHRAGVKATFFVPGTSAGSAAGRAFVQKAAAAGHEVGLLGLAGPHRTSAVLHDIRASRAAVASALAAVGSSKSSGSSSANSSSSSSSGGVVWYRPQDGSRDARVLRSASAEGLGVAYWSVCPYEWNATAEAVAERTREQLGLSHTLPATAVAMRQGVLDPRAVKGAVVCLHAALPDYLAPSPAAGTPQHDVVAATQAVLRVLLAPETGLTASQLVTLSTLCPNAGKGREVIPVE